jgi:tetratricopeptide (TPR) repeat protein
LGTGKRRAALHRLSQAAIKQQAWPIAEQIHRVQLSEPTSDLELLRLVDGVLEDYSVAKRPEAALAMLDKLLPELAAGKSPLIEASYPKVASVYEAAGKPEHTFAIYDRQIQRGLLLGDEPGSLATNFNNLAYAFSTTNRRIDEGLLYVRRALALSSVSQDQGRRSGDNHAYIDTQGWLLYRKGDLERAQAEIERSLRHARGATYSLSELYDHLATILEERGKPKEAGWLRVLVAID